MTVSVATWNTQWATTGSDRGRRISAVLEAAGYDVVVVTEGVRGLLPSSGFVVDGGDDWGYGPKPERRKVIIWSRHPLELDVVGVDGGTRGRLAVASAATPSGPVRIIGVCIPWRDAHVTTGRGDASPWSEHMDYLDRFRGLLDELGDDEPTVIAGDFNQRIPRGRQPVRVADRLGDVLGGWTIHTAGTLPNGPHIDHIATNGLLVPESVTDWPASDDAGRLSDHAGVSCRLAFSGASVGGDRASASARVAPSHNDTVTADDSPAPARRVPPSHGGAQPAELRAEIEEVLRRSGEGLSHGATFQLREQGLSDAEIAAKRGVGVAATRVFLRSLDALLSGTLPTTKSLAETNSYVYRELLNHPRSDNLDSHVRAQLAKLKAINPKVRFDPLKTRSHQYRVGERKPQR